LSQKDQIKAFLKYFFPTSAKVYETMLQPMFLRIFATLIKNQMHLIFNQSKTSFGNY